MNLTWQARVGLCPYLKSTWQGPAGQLHKGDVRPALGTNWNKTGSGNVPEYKRVMLDELPEKLLDSGSVTTSVQNK